MMPLGVYDGDAAAVALEDTLNHLLVNVLTEVVPLKFIEEQADLPEGQITGPIAEGVSLATDAIGDNLLAIVLPELADTLDGPLSPVLGPVENLILPAILAPITEALSGESSGSDGPTGTPLDLLLGPITEALLRVTGEFDGPTGTPLDAILSPLLDALSF